MVRPFRESGNGFQLSNKGKIAVQKCVSHHETVNKHVKDIMYEEYDYPFENLCFEGGGVKGLVYAGAYKVSNRI